MDDDDTDNDDKYNGLMTKIWGPYFWETIHCISFGFPMEPTEEQKKYYKDFFINLGHVLPCKYCRLSYQEFIKEPGTLLDDNVVSSRENITKWAYKIHEKVNKKLGITYNVSYNDVVNRYETYRAKCDKKLKGCVMPVDKKAESYKKELDKEELIIPYNIANRFCEYALKVCGIKFDLKNILEQSKNINSDKWKKRNKICRKIIKYMRLNKLYGIDQSNGKIICEEIILIGMMCSTLCIDELKNIDLTIDPKNLKNKKIYTIKF